MQNLELKVLIPTEKVTPENVHKTQVHSGQYIT